MTTKPASDGCAPDDETLDNFRTIQPREPLDGRSSPTWVAGIGHVPLDAARARALDDLREAEAVLAAAIVEEKALGVAVDEIVKRRSQAVDRVREASSGLERHRRRVAYVCGIDTATLDNGPVQ